MQTRRRNFEIAISYTIRYRRPDAPWSVVKMTVPDGADAALTQKMRLQTLGYSVIDIVPALPTDAPPALSRA